MTCVVHSPHHHLYPHQSASSHATSRLPCSRQPQLARLVGPTWRACVQPSSSSSSPHHHSSMQPRHPLQHRLRLLVSSHAAGNSPAGGTPNSNSSSTATRRASLGATPTASPMKGTPTAGQQLLGADQPGGSSSGSGGPFNPNWLLLVATAALGIVICYADRSNMSTAILPMAETYHWDKAFEGVVLSAFFAGYAATQVLGGSLADKYGGKRVLTTGVALWSLFTVVTPQAAAAGTAPLLAARVLLGVGEGVAFPAIHSIISRNVPPAKRSTAVGVVTAASYAGTALAFGLSPWLISRFGWQAVFYLFGGSALAWLPLWLPLRVLGGSDSLAAGSSSSSSSSSALLKGGKASPTPAAGAADAAVEDDNESGARPLLGGGALSTTSATAAAQQSLPGAPPPASAATGFAALMRRREVWAICGCQYAQSYGMYGLLTWLPSFFADYYGVTVGELGGYTLLPYALQGAVGLGAGALADELLSRRGWAVRRVRVVLQLVGMLGPAGCLLAAVSPAAAGSPGAASGLITVGLGLSALTLGGVSVSHLDIAPRHAGQVFGAGNTAATLAGLVAVPLTGWVLQTTGSWSLVFGIIAAHFVVGSALWAAWVGDSPLPEDGGGPALLPAAADGGGAGEV